MNSSWHGLVKILEIQHIRNNEVIWEDKNILNTLHVQGEMFLLQCAFSNAGTLPPANLYFGLDSRPTISITDTLASISEPSGNGYARQPVSTSTGFSIDIVSGIYRASSQVIAFSATGGGYGPLNNLFLATTSNNTGLLIASNPLTTPITLVNGDNVTMRMSVSLQDYSA